MNERGRRKRRSGEEILRLVEEFRESGLSVRAFSQQTGVAPPTVYEWLKKFPSATRLVPVRLAPSVELLRLVRPDGWRIEFPRGLAAAELHQLIQGLSGC